MIPAMPGDIGGGIVQQALRFLHRLRSRAGGGPTQGNGITVIVEPFACQLVPSRMHQALFGVEINELAALKIFVPRPVVGGGIIGPEAGADKAPRQHIPGIYPIVAVEIPSHGGQIGPALIGPQGFAALPKPGAGGITIEIGLKHVEGSEAAFTPGRIGQGGTRIRQDADGRIELFDCLGQRNLRVQEFRFSGFVGQYEHPALVVQPHLSHEGLEMVEPLGENCMPVLVGEGVSFAFQPQFIEAGESEDEGERVVARSRIPGIEGGADAGQEGGIPIAGDAPVLLQAGGARQGVPLDEDGIQPVHLHVLYGFPVGIAGIEPASKDRIAVVRQDIVPREIEIPHGQRAGKGAIDSGGFVREGQGKGVAARRQLNGAGIETNPELSAFAGRELQRPLESQQCVAGFLLARALEIRGPADGHGCGRQSWSRPVGRPEPDVQVQIVVGRGDRNDAVAEFVAGHVHLDVFKRFRIELRPRPTHDIGVAVRLPDPESPHVHEAEAADVTSQLVQALRQRSVDPVEPLIPSFFDLSIQCVHAASDRVDGRWHGWLPGGRGGVAQLSFGRRKLAPEKGRFLL